MSSRRYVQVAPLPARQDGKGWNGALAHPEEVQIGIAQLFTEDVEDELPDLVVLE